MKYYIHNNTLYVINGNGKTFSLDQTLDPQGVLNAVSFNEAELPAAAIELQDAGPVLDRLAALHYQIEALITSIVNA